MDDSDSAVPIENVKEKHEKNQLAMLFLKIFGIYLIIFILFFFITDGQSLYSSACKNRADIFMDYYTSLADSRYMPYTVGHVMYPALAVLSYSFLSNYITPFVTESSASLAFEMRDSLIGLMSYFVLVLIIMMLTFFALSKITGKDGLARIVLVVMMLLSAPVLFCIFRGNNLIFVFLLCILFVLGYQSENKFIRYSSYLALSVAIAFKVYPVIFALLFLKNKDIRGLFICGVTSAILFFVPFVFTDGTVADFLANLHMVSMGRSTSNFVDPSVSLIISFMPFVVSAIIVVTMFLFDKQCKPWVLMTTIVGTMILFQGVDIAGYSFVFMILPLMMFITEEKETTGFNVACLLLFLLMMILVPGMTYSEFGLSWGEINNELRLVEMYALMMLIYLSKIIAMYKSKHESEKVRSPAMSDH